MSPWGAAAFQVPKLQAFSFPPAAWGSCLGFLSENQTGYDDRQSSLMELPFAFTHGPASIAHIHLMTLDNRVYEGITDAGISASTQLELAGGAAYPEETSAGETRSAKVPCDYIEQNSFH